MFNKQHKTKIKGLTPTKIISTTQNLSDDCTETLGIDKLYATVTKGRRPPPPTARSDKTERTGGDEERRKGMKKEEKGMKK